ncbi:MAG: pitrilysin family protein [Pseudomonadota bacterium]
MTAISIPPLSYCHRRLANGLDVYALPDAETASVSVQVWYKVGSKHDPEGRSGFAHLFEHIMFKSTQNMPPEFFDRLTEDVGGFNNASTYDDFTNYYSVVPANCLEAVLWAEAERMGSLVVDQETFDAERSVVIEEFRQRIEASPYGRIYGLYGAQANYDEHPYGRPGIGAIEDLEAATLDDVRGFHCLHYRPDNAVLVVAGRFDDDALDSAIDTYFGPITPFSSDEAVAARASVRAEFAPEPFRPETRRFLTSAPNVPLPAVMISWPGLAATDSDLASLTVLDAILSKGESSRLYKSLVYEQQIASEAFTLFEPTIEPSVYAISAILADGETADAGERSVLAETSRLVKDGITANELIEAKNELITEKLEARETAFGRGFDLAEAVIRYGDPSAPDRLLEEIQAVTTGDVLRIANRIFVNPVSIIHYVDQSDDEAQPNDQIVTAQTIKANPPIRKIDDLPHYALKDEDTRQAPPAPRAPVSPSLPLPEAMTLANGMRIVRVPKPGAPLVSATLRMDGGEAGDPPSLIGLTDLTAQLTTKGAGSRDAIGFASAAEQLGASITPGADKDSSTLSLTTRLDNLTGAFSLFADAANEPRLEADELDRLQKQTVDELALALSEPSAIAARVLARALFGKSGYGQLSSPETISQISRNDVAARFSKVWQQPHQAILTIAGDISTQEIEALCTEHFANGASNNPSADLNPQMPLEHKAGARIVAVDLPGAGQAAVYAGMVTLPRTDPDFLPLLLATTVLGGGYSARLNMEIRVKRGLSYGAGASLAARRAAAPLVAGTQTRNDAAGEVISLIETAFAGLPLDDLPEEELEARKSVLVGSFGRQVETTAGLVDQLSSDAFFGLDGNSFASYPNEIAALTVEDVKRAAKTYLALDNLVFVVAGDAASFMPSLKSLGKAIQSLKADEIDFAQLVI